MAKILCSVYVFLSVAFSAFSQDAVLTLPIGHSDAVKAIAVDVSGKYLLSGGSDGKVCLWEIEKNRLIRTTTHKHKVIAVAFFTKQSYYLSASEDGIIKIYELKSGIETASFDVKMTINALALSRDDQTAIVCGTWLKIVNLSSGEITEQAGHESGIVCITVSNDGRQFATGDYNGEILLWKLESISGQLRAALSKRFKTEHNIQKGHSIKDIQFSPEGRYIAVAPLPGDVSFIDLSNGNEKKIYQMNNHSFFSKMIFCQDSSKLFGQSFSETFLINTVTGKKIQKWNWNCTSNYAIYGDGRFIVFGNSKEVEIWDWQGGRCLGQFKSSTLAGNVLKMGKTGRLYVGTRDGVLLQAELSDRRHIGTLARQESSVIGISLAADESHILYCGVLDTRLINLRNGVIEKQYDTKSITVFEQRHTVAWLSEKSFVSVADKTLQFWTTGGVKPDKIWDGHKYEISSVASFPPLGLVASGAGDNSVKIWSQKKGELKTLMGHTYVVQDVNFSSDGARLVSASGDRTVRIWDLKSGKTSQIMHGHTGGVLIAKFTPDDKYILSGSDDKSLILWDASTGIMKKTFKGHQGEILDLTIFDDGRHAISLSSDQTLKLWDLTVDQVDNKELLTLVLFNDDQWVIFSPDGRFDGSPDGLRQIYFVNNLNVIPLESFFERFYTPNLWGRIMIEKNQENKIESRRILLVPHVTIAGPQNDRIFDEQFITLQVEATDAGSGMDEIRLYQNGKLLPDNQVTKKETLQVGRKFIWTYVVELLPGRNVLQATGVSKDRTESDPVSWNAVRSGLSAVIDLYILAVGINNYQNETYNLNYARADAEAFARTVDSLSNGVFKNIFHIDIFDQDAKKELILSKFDEISGRARPGDVFMFYYAGHGVMSGTLNERGSASEFFLIPSNITKLHGDLDQLKTKAISAEELKLWCAKVKAQKQLILLDACQSGGAIESFASANGKTRGDASEKAIVQLARSAGVVMMSATGTEQFASEFGQLGHGVFTYALLQGILGAADGGQKDGKITVKELEAYLNDRVPELTLKYRGKAQYPNTYSRGQDFPISVIGK